jgi:single-stranded DNA-binding protein
MLQKISLIGRVGFIDDLANVGSKKEPLHVLHFTVAVKNSQEIENESQLRDGEEAWEAPSGRLFAQSTLWARCTLWGNYAATMADILNVGDLVQVEGQLEFDPFTGGPRVYETKQGDAGAKFELNRVSMAILSRVDNGDAEPIDEPVEADDAEAEEELEPEPVPVRARARATQSRTRPARIARTNPNGATSARTTNRASSRQPARRGRVPF